MTHVNKETVEQFQTENSSQNQKSFKNPKKQKPQKTTMDSAFLSQSFGGGYCLSAHEQYCLRTSLARTQLDEKLATAPVFWGKVQAKESNYLVAVAISSSFGQIRKQFYLYKYGVSRLALLRLCWYLI